MRKANKKSFEEMVDLATNNLQRKIERWDYSDVRGQKHSSPNEAECHEIDFSIIDESNAQKISVAVTEALSRLNLLPPVENGKMPL